ncbi:YIP1 family protein [Glaciecola sp. 1036]|uniref:YIP1 family protein n=1 Tax=Alteromonadaceae TaxID=72275 RepID=UPI003CFDFA8B
MTGLLSTSINVLVAPRNEVDNIISHPRLSLIPFAALLVLFAVLWFKYYANVDFEWYKNRMLTDAIMQNPEVPVYAMEENMQNVTPSLTLAVNMFSGTMAIIILLVVRSLYLSIASNIIKQSRINITHWFAISAWSTLPISLVMIGALLYFSGEDMRYLPIEAINYMSLNNLFFNFSSSHPWAALFNTIDISMLWSFTIIALMFSKLTSIGPIQSAAISTLPFLLIYGIWSASILL